MTKSLGQIAYEALEEGAHQWPGRAWDECGPVVHEAWQAAAEAVVKHWYKEMTGADEVHMGTFTLRPYGGDEQTEHLERIGRERAVIEAARIAYRLHRTVDYADLEAVPEWLHDAINGIYMTVEALEDAEHD